MSIVERACSCSGIASGISSGISSGIVATAVLLPLATLLGGCLPLDGRAEQHLSESVPAPASVRIEASFADVELSATAGSTVDIEADIVLETSGGNATAEREIEHVAVRVLREGETLIVRQGRASGNQGSDSGFTGSSSASGRIAVRVPKGVSCVALTASGDLALNGDFGAAPVVAKTASGSIRANAVAMERLDVATASGDATIATSATLDAFSFKGASGDCTFTGGARDTRASSASGTLRLSGLEGVTNVSTASGDIALVFVAFPEFTTVTARAASGDIALEVPGDIEPVGSLTTVSGSVRSETPMRIEGRSGILTGNGPPIDLTTVSGDVRVRRRK